LTTKNSSGPGLVIGLPTLGRPVPLEWAFAFKQLSPPINFNTNFHMVRGKPVAEARNEMAEFAISVGAKYLFFIGDDTVPPAHALRQLIYRMEQDGTIGVVGGVYCSKTNPPAPLVFKDNGRGSYWDWKVGEFFQCSGLGMDCTLIRVDMLKDIPKPWFKTVDTDLFLDGKNAAELWTEDLWFLKAVGETAWKIYCDASVICDHHDVYNNKIYNLPKGSLPLRQLAVEPGKLKKAIDVGCGPLDRADQFPDYTLVRVDIREDCTPDYRCSVDNLPFDNDEFDLVFSSHVLEHFPRAKWQSVLHEWMRIVKPGGDIMLSLPNIEWAIKNFDPKSKDVMNVLYGAQSYPEDFHYTGLTPEIIKLEFTKNKFKLINEEHSGYNMILRATKEPPQGAMSEIKK